MTEDFLQYLQTLKKGGVVCQGKIVDPYIVSVDSTLLKAKGHVWHKSSMINGVVPCSGIDIDARWGFSQPYQTVDIWL